MTRSLRLPVAILGGILLVTAYALAQEDVSRPVKFFIAIQGNYTDNRDSEAEREDDTFDLYVKPKIEMFLHRDQRTVLKSYYEMAYRHRTDPSEQQDADQYHHDLGFTLNHRFAKRLGMDLADRFEYTDDPAVDKGGAVLREDRNYTLNRAKMGLTCKLSLRSDMELYARNKTKHYADREVAYTSDEHATDFGLMFRRQQTEKVTLMGVASYSMFGYDNPRGIERDFNTTFIGAGIERQFTRNLRVGAKAGSQTTDFDDDGIDSLDTPLIGLWAKGAMSESLRINGKVDHMIRDADAFPFAAQEFTEIGGSVECDVSSRITVVVGSRYLLSDYDETAPTSTVDADYAKDKVGKEQTLIASADIRYRFDPKTYVKFGYRFQDIESDVDVSFSRNDTSFVLGREF